MTINVLDTRVLHAQRLYALALRQRIADAVRTNFADAHRLHLAWSDHHHGYAIDKILGTHNTVLWDRHCDTDLKDVPRTDQDRFHQLADDVIALARLRLPDVSTSTGLLVMESHSEYSEPRLSMSLPKPTKEH